MSNLPRAVRQAEDEQGVEFEKMKAVMILWAKPSEFKKWRKRWPGPELAREIRRRMGLELG